MSRRGWSASTWEPPPPRPVSAGRLRSSYQHAVEQLRVHPGEPGRQARVNGVGPHIGHLFDRQSVDAGPHRTPDAFTRKRIGGDWTDVPRQWEVRRQITNRRFARTGFARERRARKGSRGRSASDRRGMVRVPPAFHGEDQPSAAVVLDPFDRSRLQRGAPGSRQGPHVRHACRDQRNQEDQEHASHDAPAAVHAFAPRRSLGAWVNPIVPFPRRRHQTFSLRNTTRGT